ncbi:MAG TPA: tail fiber protein [Dyella sp.]|uniref:phage tail protein n=1 Tax=Dyella sp. TaxID=1869338 RepID=UPI002F933EE0
MPVSFNFAPRNWALCNGQTMSLAQNQALFALLGTVYGGDGISTFKLPDFRARTPIGVANNGSYTLGQFGGVENVTLNSTQIPQHTHSVGYNPANGTARNPANALYGNTGTAAANAIYANSSGTQVPLNPATISGTGGNLPHSNMQPYLVLNFCIALQGVFPSHS